jgi:hypothetical protein
MCRSEHLDPAEAPSSGPGHFRLIGFADQDFTVGSL